MNVKLELEPLLSEGVPSVRPLIIAGPCSAESEEQTLETARALSKNGIKIYRAGVWKPRTRPGAFEGHGSKALPWLKKVKEETGMYVAVEVANVKHVYEALKAGIDILWLGARTTANPFAVQEIADTLKGVDIPVLVKNPINPDIELWIGAIERLNIVGIKKLCAVHRGFSIYEKSVYRNNPQWQVPIELKRRIPELPLLCDPSHICGSKEKIYEVSQEAMDLNFDGLIIESHINPEKALSDAKQQLNPKELDDILKKIIIRKPKAENGSIVTLEELRAEIDIIDDSVMDIFERRMKIADQIGKYKKEKNIAILQTQRWGEILNKRLEMGKTKGLGNEFVEIIFKAIHQESINHQNKIMNEDK
ncbi:MAG: bifunctional 3-deoxy-7-phosphoheptulonate synthase/chorismate mutase type II [Bacteroidales bacterium]|nr:bifunctional 3-deoxy-7-phosphoheptulonate synthase/chorismate mutase type II [Bacteroidales bacterium]